MDILNKVDPIALTEKHPLVTAVHSSVSEVTGVEIPVKLWFAHSDTLHFLRKGIPAVNYGVGRAGIAHTTDENIELNDLRISTKAIALSIIKLAMG
jgi:acetylornithine deacetylase/succinyl-diaminopimelate desuccinylase-like protein